MTPDLAEPRATSIWPEIAATAQWLRLVGLAVLALGIASSSLTFNWVIDHDPKTNFFPEFAGRVIYPSDVVLLVGIGIWLAGWNLAGRRPLRLGPRYVAVPLFLLVLLTAVSIVWADSPAQTGFATLRRALLFFMYVVLVNDFKAALTWTAAMLLVFGGLQAAVAWAQVLNGSVIGLTFLGEIGPTAYYYPSVGCPRPVGLGFNPNPVGAFVGIATALTYGLYLLTYTAWPFRILLLAVFEIVLLGLILTMSRAAFVGCLLGMLAATLLAWFWNRSGRKLLLQRGSLAAALVLLTMQFYPALAPVPPKCGERPTRYSAADIRGGANERLRDFVLAVPILRDNLWLGVGASNYPLELGKRLKITNAVPVHNVPLLLWAELGIVGLCSWVALMCSPLIWAWSRRRSAGVELQELLWLAPLLLMFFNSLLDFPSWATQDGRVLTMAVLGLWAGGVRPTKAALTP